MESIRTLFVESGLLNRRFLIVNIGACVATFALTGVVTSATVGAQAEVALFSNFLLYFVIYLLTRKYILNRMTDSIEDFVYRIRVRLFHQINQAELSAFEAIDKSKIQLVLGKECQVLSTALNAIMEALTKILMPISAILYILIISPVAFLFIFAAIALVALMYLRQGRGIKEGFRIASKKEEIVFQHLNHLLEGFNELQMNEEKARDLFDNDITKDAEQAKALVKSTQRKLNRALLFTQSTIYIVLGLAVFVLPEVVDQRHFPAYTVVVLLLFAHGPVATLAGSAAPFFRANESVDRIKALEAQLTSLRESTSVVPQERPAPFQRLQCDRLTFHYPSQPGKPDDGFVLGPLDLDVQRGEIVFFVGGNGSGKSTLLHLLCGLYVPSGGQIRINDDFIVGPQRAQYRDYFSIVFHDYYLFHRLLGHPQIDTERVEHLLRELDLRKVTDIDEQGRVLNLNLSTGQKKRMALLVAECDDREVYIFDEWAADQDPEFRQFFYEQYLPEMCARGKTILAATHDDKYFHIADRVFQLDRGKLQALTAPGPQR